MSMKTAALEYAARGWPIFPTKFDKTPYTRNGVLEATISPAQIEKWWDRWPEANIALDVGGAEMMALDLDPGHDIKELEANVGQLPDTNLVANTPRGGQHLFFELAPGEIVAPSASKLAKAVDVRSFHSYVLLPPSSTADGDYAWDMDGEPAFRTDEMLRLSNAGKEKHRDRDEWIIDADLPANVTAARRWLKDKAKLAVEGDGGDHCTYATAAMMKSHGIAKETALELMLDHWNDRCTPPWDYDELEVKVNNAYDYNTSPPGNMTDAYHKQRTKDLFAPVTKDLKPDEGIEVTCGRFRFMDRVRMDSLPPPSWLIEGFLAAGSYVLMYGSWATFKTFLALDITLGIALGWETERPNWPGSDLGKVLFTAGEAHTGVPKRAAAWELEHNNSKRVPNFILGDPVPLITEEVDNYIEGALKTSPEGYKVVVLDTVGRSMQGTNENAQENASAFTGLCAAIQKELNCAVIALHHTGKDGGSERGSSVFASDADTILRLDRPDPKQLSVTLTMEKQRDAALMEPRKITLREVAMGDETSLVVTANVPAKVVAVEDTRRKQDMEEAIAVADDASIIMRIDAAVVEILEESPHKYWTDADLAAMVASRDDIDQTEKTLRNRWLARLYANNEKNTCRSRYFWDGTRSRLQGKWRFKNRD